MGKGFPGDEIKCRPTILPTTCADENVNIFRIRKYFTDVAWNKVLKAILKRKEL